MFYKKRKIIGKLYTPSQNFIILEELSKSFFIGCVNDKSLDTDTNLWVYPPSARIKVVGDYVFTRYNQPKEIYMYTEEENETNGK